MRRRGIVIPSIRSRPAGSRKTSTTEGEVLAFARKTLGTLKPGWRSAIFPISGKSSGVLLISDLAEVSLVVTGIAFPGESYCPRIRIAGLIEDRWQEVENLPGLLSEFWKRVLSEL